MSHSYDVIFTGGGPAALSLISRLAKQPYWQNKKILLIDQAEKKGNDRTWCYWEQGKGYFEDLVYHRWKQMQIADLSGVLNLEGGSYTYKMIRSADLYRKVGIQMDQLPGLERLQAGVKEIRPDGRVLTTGGTYRGTHVINSILFEKPILNPLEYYFQQHFKGWFIEASREVFRSDTAMLMDFRCEQEGGPTFVYVLPVTKTRALVEYTVFSPHLLTPQRYEDGLQSYLHHKLGLRAEEYTISETESGVIPMTNAPFPESSDTILQIGTAGGWTKASSGYTFRFIQKYTDQMAREIQDGIPSGYRPPSREKRFAWYDHTLLEIFHRGKPEGREVFSQLFRKNPAWLIFRFLDDETSLIQDIRIMSTTRIRDFLPAAMRQWWV